MGRACEALFLYTPQTIWVSDVGMSRIKAIPLRVKPVPLKYGKAKIQTEAERSIIRRKETPYRKWYGLQVWKDLSWKVRLAAKFRCAMCGRHDPNKGGMVADHIKPHRGDRALFFDESNLQCLCKRCHDKVKQSEERENMGGGIHC